MATIVTRSGKGSPLTNTEVDANFTNLNTDKLESGDTAGSLTITSADINGGTIDGTVIGGATPAAGSFTTITGSDDLNIDSGTFFVDASADSVGIGTTSPLMGLHFAKSGTNSVYGGLDGNSNALILRGNVYYDAPNARQQPIANGFQTQISLQNNDGTVRFYTSSSSNNVGDASTSTERMRIDSSGRLLIGTTDTFPGNGDTNVGIALTYLGNAAFSSDSNRSIFNRNLTDGSIIEFNKDGSTIGSIGAKGGELYIVHDGATDAGLRFRGSGVIIPAYSNGNGADGTQDLGATAYRFKDLHLSGTGYVGTSLGIGTTSPSGALHTYSSAANNVYFEGNTGNSNVWITSGDAQIARIMFGDQTNNSIASVQFNNSDNSIAFTNSGLDEKMRITSAGNVGIGTTSPAAALHIAPASDNAILRLEGASAEYWQIIGATNDKFIIQNETDGNVFVIDNGNVGIGTNNPGTKLNIANGADAVSILFITGADETTEYIALGVEAGESTITAGGSGSTSNNLVFRTASSGTESEAMRITSAGKVGIGTSSPDAILEVSGASSTSGANFLNALRLTNSQNWGWGVGLEFAQPAVSNGAVVKTGSIDSNYDSSNNYSMRFATMGSGTVAERMRITSGGELLVGKTSNASTVAGAMLYDTGNIFATVDGNYCARFNRLTSTGDIVQFQKDGTTIGSIGNPSSSSRMSIYGDNGSTGAGIYFGNAIVLPTGRDGVINDNVNDFGTSSYRWDDIYATNGTIQTSDANEKQDIAELDEAERRVAVAAKGLLRKFRWKSSVAEKGDEARIHFGIIAQDLQAAFEAEGLDAGRYGMFIHSTWTDEETGEERSRMGVRYSELLAFIIAAL